MLKMTYKTIISSVAHYSCFMVHGSWLTTHGTRLRHKAQGSGTKHMTHGSGTKGSGTRHNDASGSGS